MEDSMLLAEPLFACLAGVAAIALVVITAPMWTAVASQLSQWIANQLTQASRTIDDSINRDMYQDKDDENNE
jgi:hypothetical protein